jgi:hypothetical protein
MPIDGFSKERKFSEVRHGKGFAKTERKFGREKARKQMIARVLESERKDGRPVKPRRHGRRRKAHRSSGRR